MPSLTEQLESFFCAEPCLQLAILFGSAARGALRPDSDIDLALQYDEPLSLEAKQDLIFRLETLLRRQVDILELPQISGSILKEVLCNGKILVKKDAKVLFRQMQKMIFHQADMQPYIRRAQLRRQQKFQHGK